MELQIALDRLPLQRAVDIAAAVAPYADWIEIGTSLIKEYGMRGLRPLCDAVPHTPVLADLKIVDDVEFELNLAYNNGAASATIMGLAPPAALHRAVDVAAARGAELVVDLLGLSAQQTEHLTQRLPRNVRLAAHVGKDSQRTGRPVRLHLGSWASGRPVAVAGGLTVADLPVLAGLPDVRAIVGSAVTGASDPRTAAQQLEQAVGRAAANACAAHADRPDGGPDAQ